MYWSWKHPASHLYGTVYGCSITIKSSCQWPCNVVIWLIVSHHSLTVHACLAGSHQVLFAFREAHMIFSWVWDASGLVQLDCVGPFCGSFVVLSTSDLPSVSSSIIFGLQLSSLPICYDLFIFLYLSASYLIFSAYLILSIRSVTLQNPDIMIQSPLLTLWYFYFFFAMVHLLLDPSL